MTPYSRSSPATTWVRIGSMTRLLNLAFSASSSDVYGSGEQLEGLLGVVRDQVDAAGARHLGEVRFGGVERGLARVDRADGALLALAAERVHAEPEAADHDDQGEDRERGPALRLAPRGERRDAAVGRLAPRHEVVGARDEPVEGAAGRHAGGAGRRGHRGAGGLDVVGERDRRAVGAPASGSAGRTGTSVRAAGRRARPRSPRTRWPRREPEPSAARNRAWRCSIADCGWSVSIASLSSSAPRRATMFGRGEHERVADRDLAAPHVRLEPARGQAALAVRVGQRREAGLADEVGLRRARPSRRTSRCRGTTATPTPIGPLPSADLRPSRSAWWISRLLAVAIAFLRQTRIPADSS